MANIKKRVIIDSNNLNGESYFLSILQAATSSGLLTGSDLENIQYQCLELLALKSEKYSGGESSSIKVETAENIMKSNLYTIGLYLKSLPDPDYAVNELKRVLISELYQKGRQLIDAKLNTAEHLYQLILKNKISTINYTYNATISENGIASFFKAYNRDYEAHETPASIDYQLCNPVSDLVGIEFMEVYLQNLYLENEFCGSFAAEDIHYLLSGYDEGYRDLLINIFEQVLTAALGCVLTKRSVTKLDVSPEEVQWLENELAVLVEGSLALKIRKAAEDIFEEQNINNSAHRSYITKSLPRIIANISHALKTKTLGKTFVSPLNPDLNPKIRFESGVKMDDEVYRKLIDELLICRYASDKLNLIKEKVKSFGDLEDVLLDARLSEEEITSVFDTLRDVEIAALLRRHPVRSNIETVDLSEAEQALQLSLKNYLERLSPSRQGYILKIVNQLVDEYTDDPQFEC